ncbi:hypothetical protein [Nocardioides guangzhouensis]|uniref:hypothetical protein n=1 Tax=Nocardioides guangzhouensis TaxID=2497878 RepID=UPI001FE5E29D|nr:hypothetical protein [Nocardioides guangzhouensis]
MRPTSLLLLSLLLATACSAPADDTADPPIAAGQASQRPSTSRTAQPADPTQPPSGHNGAEIITADSDYGPMLFDSTGQPIYLFAREAGAEPACYADCAAAWPPVLTTAEPSAAGQVRDAPLGTTRRTDGSLQVT